MKQGMGQDVLVPLTLERPARGPTVDGERVVDVSNYEFWRAVAGR